MSRSYKKPWTRHDRGERVSSLPIDCPQFKTQTRSVSSNTDRWRSRVVIVNWCPNRASTLASSTRLTSAAKAKVTTWKTCVFSVLSFLQLNLKTIDISACIGILVLEAKTCISGEKTISWLVKVLMLLYLKLFKYLMCWIILEFFTHSFENCSEENIFYLLV